MNEAEYMMWRIMQIRENVIHQGQRLRWRTFSQWSRIKLIQNVFLWGWTESGLWSKVTWSVHCASKELQAATWHLDRDASAWFMHLMIHWWSRIMNSQGRSQDFSKGGSQKLLTAALPRVSAGSVVLSRHEGPY